MKRGFRTKRDAELFLATVDLSQARGEWVDPTKSRTPVSVVAEEWFRAQVQVKPTTRSGYRFHLDKYVLPKWGQYSLVNVRHGEVQAWVGELSERLGPSMVRQIHLVLAGVLRYAIRDGRLITNPSDGIQLPRLAKREHGYLTHAQVRMLATECGTQAVVVLFLAYTGLRWGEMAGLKVGRINFERRRVDVAQAVSEPRGVIVWGTPKNHERRSVPFPDLLSSGLEQRCAGRDADDLVFAGADGGVFRAGNFRNRIFNAAVARCMEQDQTFPRLTPHDLRHTAASLAVSAGANVKSVQRMLGHASAAMTLDVYADLFDDDLDAVAVALNAGASHSGAVKI
ncbi:site-specific integrase [Planctomonas sp. JC2975]|uniref:tyrosine-type recombinase/integrase n=1 Tax=Planctomonas sp. JC2975 TaxID=2729626 RepID=UPI001F0EA3BA|nr:site-specific integrase [Planctomonas sp. JC2975]